MGTRATDSPTAHSTTAARPRQREQDPARPAETQLNLLFFTCKKKNTLFSPRVLQAKEGGSEGWAFFNLWSVAEQ